MPLAIDRAELERFRSLVTRRLGLAFEDTKLDYLAEILRGRIEAAGYAHGGTYLARLLGPVDWREEWRALAEKLTVAETYFFRYWDHFRAFVEVVQPTFAASRADCREIRILSAGCASGEEAHSLAILAQEHRAHPGASRPVKIHGIDVNPSVIERALRARYSAWSLRETPSDLKERYFSPEGRDFVLDRSIRSLVTFEEKNLLEPDPMFWRENAFDVVFCRNVTMYFPLDVTRTIIAKIARSLVPEGYLFLGHAETLRGVAEGFHLRQTHGTFYYQRRGAHESPALLSSPPGQPHPERPVASLAKLLDSGESWFDVIQRASERIAALAGTSIGRSEIHGDVVRGISVGSPAIEAPKRPWDLGLALELLRKERFSEALQLLSALPPESERDSDAQLLRAVIMTNGGNLATAKEICRRILEADELHSGAHYLTALCLEHEGQPERAVEHDRAAAYLDATFAMPKFHLGILAKRGGDLDGARREFDAALTLLAREDPSRILLFGGGFSRDALVELCRAEIRACGGTP